MEVMVAVLMLGMLMTAILSLQNVTFASVTDYSKRLDHIFLLKNRLVAAALQRAKQEETTTQKTVGSEKGIQYSLEKMNEKSALKKFKNCYLEKVTAQWKEGLTKKQETIITFLYKAPQKKENEKK